MFKVRVCGRTTSGALVEKGYLECRGIRVRLPDGRVQADGDGKGLPVAEEVILHPPGVVSPQTAVRIGLALSAGHRQGQTDGVAWSIVS